MASELILKQKQELVENLTDKLKNAVAGVVVDYKGITVEDDTKLRRELREAGIEYFVVKNTMLRRAAENVGAWCSSQPRNPHRLHASYDAARYPVPP